MCICVCLNQCFASERVHMGVQLHAPQLRFAKAWGLAHRGREFLQNRTETEEGLTGDSKLLQTLEEVEGGWW